MAAYGRMREASPGKDSVTGHWELMGLVLDRPFPTFPNGFPPDVIEAFEARIGRKSMANVVGSGTEIMDRFGAEHMRTGQPIVYTSADSVFQILAHEDVIPIEEQYAICRAAYAAGRRGHGRRTRHRAAVRRPAGRVQAHRQPARLRRAAAGRDAARSPRRRRRARARGREDPRPLRRPRHLDDAADGQRRRGHGRDRGAARAAPIAGSIFVNLVDFDTQYGHRNDVAGYARNLERFDARLAELLPRLRPDDLLVVTADHGNDPTTPSTDHSREHVPVLALGAGARPVPLGDRATFADLGQTLAEIFGVAPLAHGTSFCRELWG